MFGQGTQRRFFCVLPVDMLYLIPTLLAPDTRDTLSPQVIRTVERLEVFLVEHPKTARRFMRICSREKDLDAITLFVLNKKTEAAELQRFLDSLPSGTEVGVLSEAGCPGVADPGAQAVAYAHRKGWPVMPLVGASSILLALMGSGFSGQRFAFHGYLPIRQPARNNALRKLEQESRKHQQTQLFMETPYRNNAFLKDLLRSLHPETQLCIAADLTAPNAFIRTLTVREWQKQTPDIHKRPAMFALHA